MNLSLEQRLIDEGVSSPASKSADKVKILSRWCKTFPELLISARYQQFAAAVALDAAADQSLAKLETDEYTALLPDDASAMPSYRCISARMPNLTDLVSDVGTKCDEIVIVDAGFQWSAVLVNHGSPQLTGRHFLRR